MKDSSLSSSMTDCSPLGAQPPESNDPADYCRRRLSGSAQFYQVKSLNWCSSPTRLRGALVI